jgi:phosphoenolpyruvate carboxylase
MESCAKCSEDMRCTHWAVSGYTLCTNHGGPVPSRGFFGKGRITTGAGDSFPMMRLAAKYNEMQKNGNLLSLRGAIEIIDMRIRQLAERLDDAETPQRMANLYKLWAEFDLAIERSDTMAQSLLRKKISDEFEKVHTDYMAWGQMFEALDYRRKMSEGEIKILKEIKAVITYEDMYQMMAKVLAVLIRMFKGDPKKLKEVKYEFAKITGERSDLAGSDDDEDDWGGSGQDGSPGGSGDVDEAKLLYPGNEEPPSFEGEN